MWFGLRKYISVIVLPITMLLIFGCGGGGGGGGGGSTPPPTFTITGKISREATAEAIPGATVTLYGTHLDIYTLGGTDLHGATVTTDTSGRSTQTDGNGSYSFTGVAPGAYTIRPSSAIYVFNPDKSGVLTITGSSTIYVYNPEALGNSVIGNVIYNSSFMITDNTIPNQDFKASPPGGVSQP